jgi:hypothetical protein
MSSTISDSPFSAVLVGDLQATLNETKSWEVGTRSETTLKTSEDENYTQNERRTRTTLKTSEG